MPLVRTPRTHHDRVAAHSRVEDGVAEEVVVDVPDTDPREPPAPRPHRLPCNVAQHKGLALVSVSAEAR